MRSRVDGKVSDAIPASVLVGTRNRVEPLIRCLDSVLRSNYPSLEVLILDDCSEGLQVCNIVAERINDPRIVCFRSEQQLGVAAGRNFLMQRARGDILVVIDDDAVFASDAAIRRTAELLSAAPKTGILAFQVIDHENDRVRLRTPFSQLTHRRQPHIHKQPQLVSYYLGTGHAMRRKLIERCGLYQADFLFGEEELDLSYRAIRAAYQIRYAPCIVVHHYPQASVIEGQAASRPLTELELHIRNRIWLAYKHLPLRYLITSLSVWLTFYATEALRNMQPGAYLRGLVAGVEGLQKLPRRPLRGEAIEYLRENFGRLWY